MERTPLSKTLRFEVFKRDKFTCQYCGQSAPDVVLEVDHINPIANCGDNQIMNLITSCRDCNRGKGKRKLSDSDEIKKQKTQMKELANRREQLEFMIQWRNELKQIDEVAVNIISELFKEKTGYGIANTGREKVLKIISEFGFNETVMCSEISIKQYADFGNKKQAQRAFDYIGRIAYTRSKQQIKPELRYANIINSILERKGFYSNKEHLLELFCGINENQFEKIINATKNAYDWARFVYLVKEIVGDNLNGIQGR